MIGNLRILECIPLRFEMLGPEGWTLSHYWPFKASEVFKGTALLMCLILSQAVLSSAFDDAP